MKKEMKSNALQDLFQRLPNELKDLIQAVRAADSAVQFELVMLEMERLVEELEWLEVDWEA